MPPTKPTSSSKLPRGEDVVASVGNYSQDAYHFIQEGLQYAADRVHGPVLSSSTVPDRSRHITGQQLCEGLRAIATDRWGLMARAVLSTWGVTATIDFGKIVFALIDAELFQKQPNDSIDDFANVYDFASAFETSYRIPLPDTIP